LLGRTHSAGPAHADQQVSHSDALQGIARPLHDLKHPWPDRRSDMQGADHAEHPVMSYTAQYAQTGDLGHDSIAPRECTRTSRDRCACPASAHATSMAQAHSAAADPPPVRECWWRFAIGSTATGRRQWVACQARVLGTALCGEAEWSRLSDNKSSRSALVPDQPMGCREQQDHDTQRMGEDVGRGCCVAQR